jgi:hypothetical protein
MSINARISQSARCRLALACVLGLAILLTAGLAAPLAAQESKKEEAKAGTTAGAAGQPPSEGFKWGLYEGHSDLEIGYRWVSDIAGNQDMYRSMVNLGEGPKLLRSNLSLRSNYGSGLLFDRLDLSVNNWGGDPYNTFRLNFGRGDLYEFRADYRNLNYYNFIPTLDNPLASKGTLFGQHSLNVTYRTTDLELKLFPHSKVRPYVAYSRASGFGPGFTTFAVTGNEFLLDTRWQYAANDYRGGVEISLPKLTLTVEQGYRRLRNDTGVTDAGNPSGNTNRPYIGETVNLESLNRGYHDRTGIPVSKVLAKYTPFEKLKITGRYIYSMADLESSLGEVRTGNLITLEERLVYGAALDSFNAQAKKPDHNGAFLIEFSPFSRLTLLDQFDTRSLHVSGSTLMSSTYFHSRPLSGEPPPSYDSNISHLLDNWLTYDQVRNQFEAELDLGGGFSARGGHRYTYSEASLANLVDGKEDPATADLTQHTGIVGLNYRPGRWMHLGLDYETNYSKGLLTRTDLLNYDQLKFDWHVNPWKTLGFSGRIALLQNTNPKSDIDFKSHNRNYSVAVNYEPNERFSLNLDYERSNLLSDIAILLPQTLKLDRSYFDERGSSVGGSMGVGIYRGWRTDFGYRAILNAGSFPLSYYQPFAIMSVPLPSHLAFKTYWQYFGYNEKGTSLQDYRGHMVTFSLAYSY